MRKFPTALRKESDMQICPNCENYAYRQPLSVKHTVFNAAVFQGAWLDLLVFHTGLAVLFICLLGMQLWRLFKVHSRYLLLPLIAVFCLGLLLDSLFSFLELFRFGNSPELTLVIPNWLVMLWLAFSLSLPISFSWLLHKPSLAVGVFACMAPLSYIAGRHIGVIEFSNSTILLISIAWALVAYLSCRWVGSAIKDKANIGFSDDK